MKCRTSEEFIGKDIRTECQWAKVKKIPVSRDAGERLYSNRYCSAIYSYYAPDQVRDMTEAELAALKKEKYEKYVRRRERQREAEQQRREEEVIYRNRYADVRAEYEVRKHCMPIGMELMKMASMLPAVSCSNPSKVIVFDTETTGLSFADDEILQISIIDGDGNILINEYVKPYWTIRWSEAQAVNGITPEMVKDAPYAHELIPKVKGIFQSADLVIAYNNAFDLKMLEKWGIQLSAGQKQYDVMYAFAEIYGEWNEHHQDYKWQKLIKCAEYFGYEFDAHDSLEDARATLFSYYKIQEFYRSLDRNLHNDAIKDSSETKKHNIKAVVKKIQGRFSVNAGNRLFCSLFCMKGGNSYGYTCRIWVMQTRL